VNRLRVDDLHAYIYRTHDGGKSWQKITNGLPDNAPVNVVREDPLRKGLLFAGSETSVWVSFNDGDNWQSLQTNLPATSVRDLVVHDDDVVVGTHGRSFWILDDISALRQLRPNTLNADFLFKPATAYRYRRNTNTDTPLPPEEPAGQNPPDGAMIDYFLKTDNSDVKLEILDASFHPLRSFPNTDRPAPGAKELHVPTYWVRPPQELSKRAGMHRFVWDLHFTPPDTLNRDYPISAIYHDTPLTPQGIFAPPGEYIVRLTVGGHEFMQPLVIKADPRVKATPDEYAQQFALEQKLVEALQKDYTALQEVRSLRAQLKDVKQRAQGTIAASISKLDQDASALEGTGGGFGAALGGQSSQSLARLNGDLSHLYEVAGLADAAPTTQTVAAAEKVQQSLSAALARWNEVKGGVAPLNQQLQSAGLPTIDLTRPAPPQPEDDAGGDEP
jgi:hypothetical protein